MKKNRETSLLLALLLLSLVMLLTGGCQTPDSHPDIRERIKPIVTQTNVTEVIKTNFITQIIPVIVTNSVNQVETVFRTNTISTVATNWQTNIVSEVNPSWSTALSGIRSANSALNPTPSAPIVNGITYGVGAILAWFAAFQNNRRKKAEQLASDQSVETSKFKQIATTIIAGVEAAKNPDVKANIAQTSVLMGTNKLVDDLVRKVTNPGPNG